MPRALLLKKSPKPTQSDKYEDSIQDKGEHITQWELANTQSDNNITSIKIADILEETSSINIIGNNFRKHCKHFRKKKGLKLIKCEILGHVDKDAVDDELFEKDNPNEHMKLERQKQQNVKVKMKSLAMKVIGESGVGERQHFVKWMSKDGTTVKIWECGICHKEFLHKYTLMRHLPIHTDERNFDCDICGKAFRQASTLSRHKAIHSSARPFLCSECGKAFNRSSSLIAHRKTHCQNRPHKCHVCGKGFHQKGNLKNHVFTHTGERPYHCETCGRGFNQISNLVCHKAHAHVKKSKHICSICWMEFPLKFSLRSHEEYMHGIKYDVNGEHPVNIEGSRLCNQFRKGRPVNGPTSKTVTLPNGDKTIKFLHPIVQRSSIHQKASKICFADASTTTEDIVGLGKNGNIGYQQNSANVNVQQIRPESTEQPKLVERSEHCNQVTTIGSMSSLVTDKGDTTTLVTKTTGILIDPITTPAMIQAQRNEQIPFALLKPVKGIPILVKILPTSDGKQVLVPANTEDLKASGRITVHSTDKASKEGAKSVQINVSVVAIVTQKLDNKGAMLIDVEAVDNSRNDSTNISTTLNSQSEPSFARTDISQVDALTPIYDQATQHLNIQQGYLLDNVQNIDVIESQDNLVQSQIKPMTLSDLANSLNLLTEDPSVCNINESEIIHAPDISFITSDKGSISDSQEVEEIYLSNNPEFEDAIVHLSCANALTALSDAAIINQNNAAMYCTVQSSPMDDVEAETQIAATEVIQNAIENLNQLNNFSGT